MELPLSGGKVLSITETAGMLGISVSSVRNWVRHGFIESVLSGADDVFLVNDVVTLRSKIERGELGRLKSRANKINSSRTFLPGELPGSSLSGKSVSFISDFIIESGIDKNTAMFMISLNLLYKTGLLEGTAPGEILSDDFRGLKSRINLTAVLNEWKRSIMRHNTDNVSLQLLNYDFPEDDNIAGAIYQSILIEGDKSRLCFLLPESFLNVKIHRDIRGYVLTDCAIERIEWGQRIFKNVFTSACIVDLKRTKKNGDQDILVVKDGREYSIKQNRFKNNRDFNFDINISPKDEDILNRVYEKSHITLKGNADWALGIVTGNNSVFLSKEKRNGMEPVITGKDISPFNIREPSLYIRFEKEKFQQCSHEDIYRGREKLVYKFISKKLIFALDEKGYVTLNSANILIPGKDLPPAKVMTVLLNSDLYQFIFQKRFSSLKVLKSHLEELPIPLLESKDEALFIDIAEDALKSGLMDDLNRRVYEFFNISRADADYINGEIR
jgi:hypothetical protein